MAQSVEEANVLAQDGNIEGAIAMLRSVTAANPSDNGAALALGEMQWNAGRDAEAEQTYTALRAKGERKATLELARMAMLDYRLDEARELLDAYRKSLVKGRKKLAEDESGDFEDQLEKISTMLDRVQNIEVIDSVDVDAVEFFRHYPLSSAAGTLGGREMLPDGIASGDMTTAHITESGGRMVWSAPDSAGNYRLYGSSALLGNEWEVPKALGEELAENGDALYPFLMPDGITLYYASDGDDSLGGFDIFQTREGEDGYLQPTNIGMPYNSPFNDYMLAVDEYTGAGWFASDRNRIPGKVTIYTFIPQEMRVNVDVDNPRLAPLARLSSIGMTQKPDADYSELRRDIAVNARRAARAPRQEFQLAMPGGKVYTSMSQFRSREAAAAMKIYLEENAKFNRVLRQLDALRDGYARGDRSQASLITSLESKLDAARAELQTLRNRVVTLEQNH